MIGKLLKLISTLLIVCFPYQAFAEIDISGQDLNDTNVFTLDGEWEFYWKEFIQFGKTPKGSPIKHLAPKLWSDLKINGIGLDPFGYGSYHTVLILPDNTPKKIAFKLNRIKLNYSLIVNGVLIGSAGQPGTTPTESQDGDTVKLFEYDVSEKKLDIIIHTSNFTFSKGGMTSSVQVGSVQAMEDFQTKSWMKELLISTALGVMAIYHLGLWLKRRKDFAALSFSIFCFSICVRMLVTSGKLVLFFRPETPADLILGLDIWSVFIGTPIMHYFISQLFPNECKSKYLPISYFTWLVLMMISLTGSIYWMGKAIFYFEIYCLILLLHTLYVAVAITINRRSGAILFSAAIFVFFVTAINDILNERNLIHTGFYLQYGVLLYALAQGTLLSNKFADAYNELEMMRLSLESQVIERTKELSLARDEAVKASEEIRLLSSGLSDAIEKTTKNIAIELHDNHGATLISLKLKSRQILKKLETEPPSAEIIKSLLTSIIDTLSELYDKNRSLVKRLRPATIDTFGLLSAINDLADSFSKEGRTIEVSSSFDLRKLPSDFEIIDIYRIVQEALTNIEKYSEATSVLISFSDTAECFELRIVDNGKGFESNLPKGTGLVSMRERAIKLKGKFFLESVIGSGTDIKVQLPKNN